MKGEANMNLIVKKMNEEFATEILNWRYERPYDFYNNELTTAAMEEMMDGSYSALLDNREEFIGFFCTGESAQVPKGHQYGVYKEDFVDMGLGMNPKFVGVGNGFEFCSFIIQYIKENEKGKSIRLTVATFNERAIHLYKKLGFEMKDKFSTDSAEFITMVKEN